MGWMAKFDPLDITPGPRLADGPRAADGPPAPPPGREPKKAVPGRPQQLLELACRAARAAQGGVGFLSPEGELVEFLSVGLPAELWHSPWLTGLIRFVLDRPGPVRLADLRAAYAADAPAGLEPPGPFLGAPLAAAGRCRGLLYLGRAPGAEPFTPDDLEAIKPVATWFEQGTLFEEARLLSQLRLLNQVAQAAAGNLDLAHILQTALRELDRHLPLHVGAVWLAERDEPDAGGAPPPAPKELVLAAVSPATRPRAAELGLVPGVRLAVDRAPFAGCLTDGQAVYADLGRPEAPPTGPASDLAARGATSFFAVPLRGGDRVGGVLQSVSSRPAGLTQDQMQLLYLLADLLGPAISNCQLYARVRAAYDELRLTQNQLVQAEKMRALGELAGGMAHEFNNSLCGTLGFLELALMGGGLPDACRGYLESARTCAQDAAHTVRRVQDFARQQRNELAFQVLDLNELVKETVELVRHKWESLDRARGQPVVVEVKTKATVCVYGSPTELREVLTNLVFNAVDAMPQGGTLRVYTWSTSCDVVLSVQDTGVGINEAVRKRLFEPFFTTKGERGNGLGLSVAFGIVKRHGGEILVESQVGRGSTFSVRLPFCADEARPEPRAQGLQLPVRAARGLRVLVVEDEESIRRFLETGLKQLGHQPRLTANGREGLDVFAQERFDVVLTDLGMPEVSGEEVARTLARTSPQTPVVLLTGWADQLQAEIGAIEGVTHILSKPVSIANLAATLTSVCAQKRSEAAAW